MEENELENLKRFIEELGEEELYRIFRGNRLENFSEFP